MKLVKTDDSTWNFDDEKIDFLAHEELDKAINLWHQGYHELSEIILKKIIDKNPNHIDALHHLSMIYEETFRDLEAYICCREAVRVGLSVIPSKFSWKKSKLKWSYLDNRPFLRAYHNLGLWLKKRNEINSAIEIFTNMLAICPNDNIGVRYVLPALWLHKGDFISVIKHCEQYQNDTAPEILYTYALALGLSGEIDKAKILLIKAKEKRPLVAKELKKKRHKKPKSLIPGTITVGGEDQAYEYWVQYGKFWQESEIAITLLNTL